MTDAPYPHCNTEVLHAPGTCAYCDEFPDRQAQRVASNTPFTPAEANGWYGNVAQPKAWVDPWAEQPAGGGRVSVLDRIRGWFR